MLRTLQRLVATLSLAAAPVCVFVSLSVSLSVSVPLAKAGAETPRAAPPFVGLEVLNPPVPGPDLALVDLSGMPVPLSGAPVTVLNFWATWCAPCVAELPTLIALDKALSDRGLRVVAASLDRSPEQIEAFWTQQGFSDGLEIVLDNKGDLFRSFSADALGARGVPYTAVLNGAGEVVSWYAGEADWASEDVLAYFEALLLDPSVANETSSKP